MKASFYRHLQDKKSSSSIPVSKKDIILLVILGLAVYLLLPRVGDVHRAIGEIRSANVAPLLLCLAAMGSAQIWGTVALQWVSDKKINFWPTFFAQFAFALAGSAAPRIGVAALTVRYLNQCGNPLAKAVTSTIAVRVIGVTSTLIILPGLLVFMSPLELEFLRLPADTRSILLIIAMLALLLGTILLVSLKIRRIIVTALSQARGTIKNLWGKKIIVVFLASWGVTLSHSAMLYFVLVAVGANISFIDAVIVYEIGSTLSSLSPTPGGLGAAEATFVVSLLAFGVVTETAVAGVLIFRLFIFWLPILPGVIAFRKLARQNYL